MPAKLGRVPAKLGRVLVRWAKVVGKMVVRGGPSEQFWWVAGGRGGEQPRDKSSTKIAGFLFDPI